MLRLAWRGTIALVGIPLVGVGESLMTTSAMQILRDVKVS